MFTIKCFIKKKPYTFFIGSLILSILIFSQGIRMCELPLSIRLDSETFESYITTMWMIMITMTTVGYGDYYPRTLFGRILCFCLCIWGIFLMSLIVVILFQSLELSYEEKQALIIFNKLEAKKPLAKTSARMISEFWIMKTRKNHNPKDFYKSINEFKIKQKELKILESVKYDYFYEQLNLYF